MAACVGIIANPAAAHDIRRLSGHGSIVDYHEKTRLLRRVLLGLQAVGVTEALAMPDHYSLASAAASASDVRISLRVIEMICAHNATDSTHAAQVMAREGCACIVTLGGDGTNRAVAKGSGETPLLAISTGTNNVFPRPIEGTVAGLAAGLFARGLIPEGIAVSATKHLEVIQAENIIESALVDIAVSNAPFLGALAITDTATLSYLWLTQAAAGSIGLSAIGAHLSPLSRLEDEALLLELAAPETGTATSPAITRVLAPIAPGLLRWVGVRSWRRLRMGAPVIIDASPCVLSLDGERAIYLPTGDPPFAIRATWGGPRLLDVQAILDYAAQHGLFIERAEEDAR
ncbi:MAG TPA: NAD(+)/NADH kinase [Ktedonobacterales bacterium]|jgi:predicted polyphosphate/ATP-dependent NAD kinase|nr:NAD(+)/NADH kinase [Ktedonobacterales bacterium]